MSNVYQEKPNIVTIQITDDTGTAERFIVGRSLDEVIAIIQPEAPCAGPKPKKKDRKPRRTRAEINEHDAKARIDAEAKYREGSTRSAGEEAMDRLKKQAAEDQPKEIVWP